jgi:hypothetical protein
MKTLSWITAATSVLTVVLLICSVVSLSKLGTLSKRLSESAVGTTSEPGKNSADETAVLELCRRGLVLLGQDETTSADSNDTRENGGAMVQNAWALQSQYPKVVDKIWFMTGDWASQLPQDRRYLTLSLYLQSVNDAIDSCDQPDDFDLLWQVRKQVTSRIEKVEQARTSALSTDLAKLIKEVDGKQVEKLLLSPRLPGNIEELRSRLETLDETSDELPKPVKDHLQTINETISAWFEDQIIPLEKRYATEKQRDVKADEITPASSADKNERGKGQYAQLLTDVEQIWKMWVSPEAQFWMQLNTNATAIASRDSLPEDANGKSGSLDQRLESLQSDIIRSVRIRYNLWAVKEIYQAGRLKGARGCVALGRIDNGLLDPSVSALYSETETMVFRSIEDPFQHTVQVRRMLLTEPIGLDAF